MPPPRSHRQPTAQFEPRTVLLTIFGVGWLAVVVITAANNNGNVPQYLWGVLGIGVGTIMGAFRMDDMTRRGGGNGADTEPPDAPARSGESGARTP